MASSVLAGPLVLLAALWAWYMLNRLWQIEVEERAAAALASVGELGLVLRPAGLRARRVAVGRLSTGEDARVVWRGGLRGLRCQVSVHDREAETPLLLDREALTQAIRGVQGR